MKTAKLFWSVSSILINITIAIYIYLQQGGPKDDLAERFQYVNENWGIYAGHWKVEFLLMTLMMIGATYFMVHFKSINWSIVSIGQLIILLTYPLMLGGYENTSFEVASMVNQVATITFIFGNFIFFIGMTRIYFEDKLLAPWIRKAALALSIVATLLFASVFGGIYSWNQVLAMAPLINILYLINAYLGFKM